MNIFKSYTYTWWQVGILKLALVTVGIFIGSYWPGVWIKLMTPVALIAILASAYTVYISLKQV